MPFDEGSYDIDFASHVLEHVRDDAAALAETPRVLKPGGFAVLPVPEVSPYPVEYPEPNPLESGPVRAIGTECVDAYRAALSAVRVWESGDFDRRYQLYANEHREHFPTGDSPYRVRMKGTSHPDYVPVCFA